MRRLSLALAVSATLAFPLPADAGHAYTRYNFAHSSQQSAPPADRKKGRHHDARSREPRALQIRRECRLYAFHYWRYHPDYQHCRHY